MINCDRCHVRVVSGLSLCHVVLLFVLVLFIQNYSFNGIRSNLQAGILMYYKDKNKYATIRPR